MSYTNNTFTDDNVIINFDTNNLNTCFSLEFRGFDTDLLLGFF